MKSAEEWVKFMEEQGQPAIALEDCIHAIQADALRHAVSIAANEYDKGGTCHDIAVELQSEIAKLDK